MIDAIRNIYNSAKLTIVFSAVVSLLSGAFSALLIAQISAGVNERFAANFFLHFSVLVVLTFVSTLTAQLLSLHLTATYSMRMRVQLCRTIIDTSLRRLEEIGSHRLLAALTQDAGSVAQAAMQIPQLCMNLAIIVCSLLYLGYVSIPLFLGMLVLLPLSVISYRIPERRAVRYSSLERDNWDELVECFEGVIRGVKELKLNRARRRDLESQQLVPLSQAALRYGTSGASIYVAMNSWGNLLCFVVIGVLFGVLPHFSAISRASLVTCALITLYLRTPILGVLQALREVNRAAVALKKLKSLGLPWELSSDRIPSELPAPVQWQQIELIDVRHEYQVETDDHWFCLGPINLTLTPGSLVFVTGGNGCGKTTLAKLLTGLYMPQSGLVRLSGNVVGKDNIENYRQHFSAVFSDFALFERIIDADSPERKAEVDRYLRLLQLSNKVRSQNGRLSTTQLSAGQRRRLALLHAYLEDRPIYVFDEWAADQDREFKEVFYRILLPQMRDQGKAVVVISHDDRYYEIADRIIRLENGKIIETPGGLAPPTSNENVGSIPAIVAGELV